MGRLIVVVCVVIFMMPAAAVADGAGKDQFVRQYVAAVNAKDKVALKKMIHPECLACINDGNRHYYEDYFFREFKAVIPDDYKINRETSIDKDSPLMGAGHFSYPVRPSHWVQIEFNKGPHDSVSILRQIVQYKDAWVMVMPCPTQETVKRFFEVETAKKAQKKRAKALFRELKDPLLSELKALLSSGKKVQAMKRYRAETGESLSMAKAVCSLIQ